MSVNSCECGSGARVDGEKQARKHDVSRSVQMQDVWVGAGYLAAAADATADEADAYAAVAADGAEDDEVFAAANDTAVAVEAGVETRGVERGLSASRRTQETRTNTGQRTGAAH